MLVSNYAQKDIERHSSMAPTLVIVVPPVLHSMFLVTLARKLETKSIAVWGRGTNLARGGGGAEPAGSVQIKKRPLFKLTNKTRVHQNHSFQNNFNAIHNFLLDLGFDVSFQYIR